MQIPETEQCPSTYQDLLREALRLLGNQTPSERAASNRRMTQAKARGLSYIEGLEPSLSELSRQVHTR